MHYDPVCGIQFARGKFTKVHGKETYHFCSKICEEEFAEHPKKFTEGAPVIELVDVHKDYLLGEVKVHVLKGLSFRIWKGDFVALIGASGSGKSTAMNMMGCLDTPTKGKIFIDGVETSKMTENRLAEIRGTKIGFVFQQFNLLGALNCMENIALPLFFQKGTKAFAADGNVDKLINTVQLQHRGGHKPLEMSGGEQQRAAIARALVNNPEVVLADEPTGNLDSKTGKIIMEMLKELNKEGKTIIVVTHDPSIAKEARRILNLKDGMLISGHRTNKDIIWQQT